jgi:lactate permease
MAEPWIQVYDPLGNPWLSTAAAALPIVLLLFTLGVLQWRAHIAALTGLVSAIAVSAFVYSMPVSAVSATALYGAAYGLLPIGWIVLNAVFLYNLTVQTGQFEVVKSSVGRLSRDRRIQALLVAFSFGAFIEGAAGFGTPVAICSALLMGLGFTPLYAAGLSLIANTAPVAFGAIGTPILTLAAVTDISAMQIGMMAGRQLPFVSLIVPAWLVVTMSGWRGLRGVWPAVLVWAARLRSCSSPGATSSAPNWSTSSADSPRLPPSRCSHGSGSRQTSGNSPGPRRRTTGQRRTRFRDARSSGRGCHGSF